MILKPTTGMDDWKEFVASPTHWRAGYSAMETARSWETARGLPAEIAALFAPGAELLLAIPEYKVALPGGGRDSQNDVFALIAEGDDLVVCMIEGKRDEPFGPTLEEWRTGTPGRETRLAAICEMLDLDQTALAPTLRYQLFHRAASALSTAGRFRTTQSAMIVQSFSPDRRWFRDFADFCALFGLSPGPDEMVPVSLSGGRTLRLGWAFCRVPEGGE